MTCFGLKQGQDFKISAAHPQQEFLGLLSPPPTHTHTHTHKMYINSKSVSYCFHINTAIKIISTHGSCFTYNCRFYLSLHLAEVLSVNHAHCTSHAHARKNIFLDRSFLEFFFFTLVKLVLARSPMHQADVD